MALISQEVSNTLTLALITILGFAASAVVAWLKMKTRQWEQMTEMAIENSRDAVKNTKATQDLIIENTRITRQASINSEESIRDLKETTTKALEIRKAARDRIISSQPRETDELDIIGEKYLKNEKEEFYKGSSKDK